MENKEVKNLYQKLGEVRKKTSYLQKAKKGFNYNYVSSSQVLESLNDSINEEGLILVPEIEKQVIDAIIDSKGKTQYRTTLDMTFTWVNIDNPSETLKIKWNGQGFDDFEKGIGKALTYAEKYFLLKFFNIATDKDDPDEVANKKLDKQEKEKEISIPTPALTFDFIKKELEVAKSYDELMKIYSKFKHQLIIDKILNQSVLDFCKEFKKNFEVKS